MSPSHSVKRITCPHCRSSLDGLALRAGMRRLCPYCGTAYTLTDNDISEAEVEIPDRVISFTTDRKDFEREVLKSLARNEQTPLAIFDSINFTDAEGLFYPAWQFEGTYTVRRSGEPEARPRRSIFGMGKDKADGKIPFSILCPAGGNPAELPEMPERFETLGFMAKDARLYSSQAVDMTMFIPTTESKDDIWHSHGSELLCREVSAASDGDCGDAEIETGERVKARLVLIPFWLATFRYGGNVYRFIMDGTDAGSIRAFLPPEQPYEKPHRILRRASDSLLVASWLSLILLFWNIWAIPSTMWALWLLTFIAVRIQKALIRRKEKAARRSPHGKHTTKRAG